MSRILCTLLIVLIFNAIVSNSLRSIRLKSMVYLNINHTSPEFLGGKSHECYRNCDGTNSRTCNYTFILSQYTSMSYACRECPFKEKDCFRAGCITAGGHIRPVTVANHMLPGPSIQVCEGDVVRVKVINGFTSDSAAIHWHGIHQIGTPYMDGAPYVTQCPILPHNEFTYQFIASPAGTHIWHSHIGYQETDGLYGSLIVRKSKDPSNKYYDYDMAEHVMLIWHWYNVSTASMLDTAHHKFSSSSGYSLLINGLASKVKSVLNNQTFEVPRAVFNVDPGKRYRFRVIYNSPIFCPIQVSIDDHDLLIIASETGAFEPVLTSSFMINAGERFDFVLNANGRPGNYWIRYRGIGQCNKNDARVSEVAILHYNGADHEEPKGSINYEDAYRSGLLLNPLGNAKLEYENNTFIKVVELNNSYEISMNDISKTPDHTFYFKFSFNTYSSHHAPGPYPQINDMSFENPPQPLLTQYRDIKDEDYCREEDYGNKECIAGYCTCPIVYRVSKNSLVEMIFVDVHDRIIENHPMHLHGNDFYVVAMETLGKNNTIDMVKYLNEQGKIKKKFQNPPLKDNISVPGAGFAIIRFFTSNPGFWLLHCHISHHMEMGMGFVLQVGDNDEMIQPPGNFPKCGNWGP